MALLAVAGVAVIAAVVVVSGGGSGGGNSAGTTVDAPAESTESGDGSPLVAGLQQKVNSVSELVITRRGLSLTLHKVGDTWRVKDKGDYPAKPESVRAVVLGIADMRKLEPKTSRPEMYAKIGVEEVDAPATPSPSPSGEQTATSQAIQVTLKEAGGGVLGDVIIGNRKPAMNTSQAGVFARVKGQAESWLCRGNIEVPREALAWMDTKFANIDKARVQSVKVTPTEGAITEVVRGASSEPFKLLNIPAGKELKEKGAPDGLGSILTQTTFSDVGTAESVDFGVSIAEASPRVIELKTFEGLTVTIKSVKKEGKVWWKLNASLDESAAKEHAAKTPVPSKPDESKPDESKPDGNKPGEGTPETTMPTSEQIDAAVAKLKQEAADLNASWSAFAFSPQDYKVRHAGMNFSELLQDPPPPGEERNSEGMPGMPPNMPPGMMPSGPGGPVMPGGLPPGMVPPKK